MLCVILMLLISCVNAFADTGWLRIERGHHLYFKPFVDVENSKKLEVLFVTSKGKAYKGKCKKRTIGKFCPVTPGKSFHSTTENIRYIILRLKNFYAPEIVKTGVIDNLNVKDKY